MRRRVLIVCLASVVGLIAWSRSTHLLELPASATEAAPIAAALHVAAGGAWLDADADGQYIPVGLQALIVASARNPLLAARLSAGGAGLLVALGLATLGHLLASEAAGVLAAFAYAVSPFALFYDRLALSEPLLTAAVVWSLVVGALWARSARVGWALALGAIVGAAGATRPYGVGLLLLPPVVACFWPSPLRRAVVAQLSWVWASALVGLAPMLLNLRAAGASLRHERWLFASEPPSAASLLEAAGRVAAWHATSLTPIAAALLAAAALWAVRRGDRIDRLMLALWAAWCLACLALWGDFLLPRHLMPALPLLLFPVARRAVALRGWLVAAGVLVFAASTARLDASILFDPASAALPGPDRFEFFEGPAAGYGVAELARTIEGAGLEPGGIVIVRGTQGPTCASLDLALAGRVSSIQIVTLDRVEAVAPKHFAELQRQPQPVVLGVEERVGRVLVLTLDGGGVAAPVSFLKPGWSREIEAYPVKGRLVPAAGDGRETPVPHPTAPAWHGLSAVGEARACASEQGERAARACRRLLARGVGGAVRAEALYHAARLLLVRRDFESAIAPLREADRIVPQDMEQHVALVRAVEDLGRYEEALALSQQALTWARAEDRPDAFQHVGWILASLGRFAEAEVALRESLALAPSYPEALNDHGVCLWLLGRRAEARASLQESWEQREDLRVRFNLAVVRASE